MLQAAFADPQTARYKPLMVEVNELREKIAAAIGKPVQALQFAHAAAALREELLGTRASRRLAALEGQYARQAADQQLALATKENQLQSVRIEQQRLQRNYVVIVACGFGAVALLLAWRFAGVRRFNRALATRNAEIEKQRAALGSANERLKQQTDELYQAAITDPLTGVFNRGHLMRQLDARLAQCQRTDSDLALLLIDFDHFKQINDKHGHLFGDRVLVAGVQTLPMARTRGPARTLRRRGIHRRHHHARPRHRAGAGRTLRVRVAETLALFASDVLPLPTISIGIGLLSRLSAPVRVESLVESADKAVYMAKMEGRNRVVAQVA